MSLTPEAGRVQAEVETLRERVDVLRASGHSMEQSHMVPAARMYISRLQKAYAQSPGMGFDRLWTGIDQIPLIAADPGKIGQDSGFKTPGMGHADRSAIPQSYAQDVLVMVFDNQRIIVPTPNQLIPVIDVGEGGPWDRIAQFADITGDGSPSGFRTALPCMNANKRAQFFPAALGQYPYKLDNVYVAIHVWPFLDATGASTIAGVDPKKGFFIIWTPPPGDVAETLVVDPAPSTDFDSDTVSDGDEVTVFVSVEFPTLELDRDGQGNVLDVRVAAEGSVLVIVSSAAP